MRLSAWVRWLFVCLLVLLLCPIHARADAGSNQHRGFSLDKVYAVGDVDSVNVFNGNLIVRIPLGPEYSVGPVLSYQFQLVYNSTIWDYRELIPATTGRNGDPPPPGLRQSVPEDYSNVGMGWFLSLGRLLMPNENRGLSYIGPDGAQHEFKSTTAQPVIFTEDGSYLRLRTINDVPSGMHYEIDFPDGTVRKFSDTGLLEEIRDPYDNWVKVDITNALWTITDGHGTQPSGRVHRIHFATTPARPGAGTDGYPDYTPSVVTSIELAAGEGAQDPVEYSFDQVQRLIGRGGHGDRYFSQPSKCLGAPMLEQIHLPDGTTYTPSYNVIAAGTETVNCGGDPLYDGNSAPPDSGAMSALVLPTRGKIEWDYDTVFLNESICGKSAGGFLAPMNGPKVLQRFVGVEERRVYATPTTTDAQAAKWTYTRTLVDPLTNLFVGCGEKRPDGGNEGWVTAPADELTVTVQAPEGLKTKHYFSVWPAEGDGATTSTGQPSSLQSGKEYGLPLTRKRTPIAAANQPTLYLSSQTFDGNTVLRESYVNYESEWHAAEYRPLNARMRDERTTFPTDTACGGTCYTEVRRSLFDDRGHYKQTVTSSNFPDSASHTTFTDYTTPPLDAPRWILGLHTNSWETDGGADTRTLQRSTVFNDKGMMESVRTLAQTGTADDDVLSVWCRDATTTAGARGYVTSERIFGAGRTIPADPCSASRNPGGDYFITHEYTFAQGLLKTHKTYYEGADFDTSDETYDAITGLLLSTKDTADLATTYEYDELLRLERVRMPGVAPVRYEYTRNSYPNSVAVVTEASTEKRDVHYFDGLGRPMLSKTRVVDGWSAVRTTYDQAGRVSRVSMPELRPNDTFESVTPAFETVTTYDVLGRVTKVVQPDAKLAVTEYVNNGDREKKKGTKESAAQTSADVQSIEHVDGAGRLVKVFEPSGPNGAFVDTKYTYDAGGHLATVKTESDVVLPDNTTQHVIQNRSFTYDLRGFLTAEQHPEKGVAGNGSVIYSDFDSKGHARTKTEGTIVTKFVFDAAERLESVRDHEDRDIKTFEYAPSNGTTAENDPDYRKGKLHVATRYNFLSAGTIRVRETYSYAGRGGRMSHKQTVVARQNGSTWPTIQTFDQGYDYDADYGAVNAITYPSCPSCTIPSSAISSLPLGYDFGLLTSVGDFATLRYHANGMVKTVQRNHPLTRIDRYESDHGMTRPSSIQFDDGGACDLDPQWATNQTVNSGATATFQVTGVAGASVTWYRGTSGDTTNIVSQTGSATYTTGPLTQTARFWCRVAVPGGCSLDSPTFVAEVCKLPEIVSPAADATPAAQPADIGQPVYAEVVAVASGITYSWTVEELHKETNGTYTSLGAPQTIFGANGPVVSWTPATRGQEGFWGLRVTVSGSCPGAIPETRLVKVVEIPNSSAACTAPDPLNHLPPERRVWWPSHSIDLDITLENGDPDDFVFEWSINGRVEIQQKGVNVFTTALHDLQPKLVTLRMWRDCGNPNATPKIVRTSAIVEQSTYLWTDESCPVPPLIVDQPELILDPNSPTAKFTASSVWPSVNFQWFKGDSGNTSNPQAAEATSAGRSLRPTAPGTYWVRATSKCGTTADSATLVARSELCAPVQFVRQPAAHTSIDAGASVALSFETYSNPAVTSQAWFAVGQQTAIGTAPIQTVSPTRTTTYYVEASSSCNTGVSAKAMVHVTSCNAIQVLQAPQPASINKDDSVLLSVSATSAFPLTYQWYEGESGDTSKPVANGNAASVTVTPEQSTKYWVRIDAGAATCAIDSTAVPVTVCRAPEFEDGEVFERNSPVPGVMHWLEADVEGDDLSYAWYAGVIGDTSTLLSGGRSIVLHPMTTTQLWLRVTSDCAAPLADRTAEAQYRISVCPEIVAQPYAVQPKVMPGTHATLMIDALRGDTIEWYTGSTLVGYGATFETANITAPTTFYAKVKSGACVITSEPVTVTLCDQPTVGWNAASLRVTKAQQQTLSVHSTSSGAEVNFTYYSGTPGNVAQSSVLSSDSYGTLGIHPDTTTTYWVRAQEGTGCYADTPGLTVDVCIPQILTQPQSKTIDPQTSTQLSVAIDLPASSRITYQWYTGQPGNTSQAVPGGTTAAITVTPSADTTYWVRITSVCNTGTPYVVDSAAATVTVCKVPAITQQPISMNGYAGIASSLQVGATGTELTYQWYRGASGDVSNAVNNATSASFAPTVSQTTDYWVKISGRCGSVNSNTARISIAPAITAQPAGGPATKGTTKTLTVTATGSYLTYQWYSGAGTANLINGATNATYTTGPINADASYWVRVSSGAQSVDSNVATFTVCQPRTINVTYSTKISGSAVLLEVSGSAADESYEWYQGATLLGTGTYISVSPQQTTDYWLRTKRTGCDADSPVVTVRVCTPKITAQPQSTSALSGTATTLTVAANGTGPLTYQWFKGGAGDTSQPVGTNSASYTTAALTTTSSYWVRISSPAQTGCTTNSVDSQVATINICNVPAISSITPNQHTTSGSSVTLTVTATGGSLQYEWHEGAVGSGPVVGSNSASLTVAPTSTKTYWVRVYNGCGTINSSAVQVSIYPTITQQPANVAACNNSTAHFTITATGTGLSYAWFRQYPGQSAQAVGGNDPYLDITATAAATVFCRVTSGDAMTVSNTVNLTVSPSPANYSLTKAVYSSTQWKLTATVTAADEGLVQYEWYRGSLGDTTNRLSVPINANLVVVTPPSLPQTYWVRVKYIDTGCATDKAITVQ